MSAHPSLNASGSGCAPTGPPPLPLSPTHWAALIEAMGLAPQEARLAELVLRGQSSKQIAAAMRIETTTIRTYFARIEAKLGLRGKMALAMRVLDLSHQVPDPACPQN